MPNKDSSSVEINFCRRCGQKLIVKDVGFWQCENNHSTYLNPAPAAAIFFVDGDSVLVSRRAIEPGIGQLDSIGGFIDSGETAELAIQREILEETGLEATDYDTPNIYCTARTKYRFENEDKEVLSMFFWSRLKPSANPIAADDVAELLYVRLADVNLQDFYGDDVKEAIRLLRNILDENSTTYS